VSGMTPGCVIIPSAEMAFLPSYSRLPKEVAEGKSAVLRRKREKKDREAHVPAAGCRVVRKCHFRLLQPSPQRSCGGEICSPTPKKGEKRPVSACAHGWTSCFAYPRMRGKTTKVDTGMRKSALEKKGSAQSHVQNAGNYGEKCTF